MVGWEGVENATSQALSGIRTYGIPIDQHINQITKQRNAQDYIGRSEALSVGRILSWEAEGKTCEITTLFAGGVWLEAHFKSHPQHSTKDELIFVLVWVNRFVYV